MKATIVAIAIDAALRHDQPPYRGKAMQTRALGYVGTSLLVPLAWRLLPGRGRYPRGLDLAISTPLLLDAIGNAAGIYRRKRIDDVVHLANGAIVAGVAGAVVAPHVDERWQAALTGAGSWDHRPVVVGGHGIRRVPVRRPWDGAHLPGHDGRHDRVDHRRR